MSAKGIKGTSRPHDTYPTNPDLVRAAMLKLKERVPNFAPTSVLEPGCGAGAPFCAVACQEFSTIQDSVGVDLLPQSIAPSHKFVQGDFTLWQPCRLYSFVATNPPFTLASVFLRKAVQLLEPGGLVLFLLRVAFLAGVRRRDLWLQHVNLREVFVLPRRPSFTPDKKTDSSDYAWFVVDGQPAKGCARLTWL